MHVWAYTCMKQKTKKKKVEEGLRRQQLPWEPRGHGGGIDFINRASQHSAAAEPHWRQKRDERTKHVCVVSGATRCRPVRPAARPNECEDVRAAFMWYFSTAGWKAAVWACVRTVCDKLEHTGKVSKLSLVPDPSGEAPRDLILENMCTVGDPWIWIPAVTGPRTSAWTTSSQRKYEKSLAILSSEVTWKEGWSVLWGSWNTGLVQTWVLGLGESYWDVRCEV